MNKNIAILAVIIVAILGYRAYKSYEDMNLLLNHETVLLEEIISPTGINSFLVTEFPSQITDFKSKVAQQ